MDYSVDVHRVEAVIKSGVTLQYDGHAMIDADGYADLPDGAAATDMAAGVVVEASGSGLSTDLVGDGSKKVTIRGSIDKQVAVTGATGIANVGDLVYTTAVNTHTLTPTTAPATGYVKQHVSSTTCIVHFFSLLESMLKA